MVPPPPTTTLPDTPFPYPTRFRSLQRGPGHWPKETPWRNTCLHMHRQHRGHFPRWYCTTPAYAAHAPPCARKTWAYGKPLRGPTWPSKCANRSEEHTSELQSLMRTSYAVLCLKTTTDLKHTHTK